jgi:hypothetical protein
MAGAMKGGTPVTDVSVGRGSEGDGVKKVPLPSGKETVAAAALATMAAGGSGPARAGDEVEQMMASLRLTAAESAAVVIDDINDLELIDPDRAFVGKVLAPNVLHIETIKAAMRPAWGNPKGLIFNPAGDNMFIAEFGSKNDRDRVMEGSPWKVGTHAVLMKKYDADVPPSQVVFDRMAI